MKLSRKPHKAKATQGEAWWYDGAMHIDVYVQLPEGPCQTRILVQLTRRQLEAYIRRSTKGDTGGERNDPNA